MTSTDIQAELTNLEQQYWQSIKDRDVATAMRLTADGCILTGAQGVSRIERKAFGDMMRSGGWSLNAFSLSDVQVNLVTDDVAIVAYKVREQLTVEGKPLALEAADASTWVRENGEWRCALHTESIAGDPFGRDRTTR